MSLAARSSGRLRQSASHEPNMRWNLSSPGSYTSHDGCTSRSKRSSQPRKKLLTSSDLVSVARIYGSGRRSSSLDCFTSAQTQILAIAVCNDLHAHRTLTHEPRGDRQYRQTQRRGRSQQKLRIPHSLKRCVALQIESVRK